ncbi:MAG: hypothetical protein A2275_03050 [Bacteroidetes bacterium RIFOXYA12_FULL_35_11]|nr:MAG: hypothetical protein A2X01_15530 [Bacteroidetes bacterium GWF2_35_48]OFY77764.1 MAG: hypothetical protein A2275_03050 [Bacteroidetes bacterium RIFOXYA12_FULL_35_11]OFY94361.1 MAG: hypothetical protein A2491_00610 [Bacteroidetes bacterium RIFOXYC12_FULL_35_7]HBX49859.1 hypothetical protein [Bacteroidales bacterium]
MELFTIFLIAIGLCFDTFAVSVSCGLLEKEISFFKAVKVASSLAFFQAFMPFAGWLLGVKVNLFIADFDHWIAFGMLSLIGLKMIYESLKKEEKKKKFNPLDIKILLWISLATSIDAFVVGISFGLISIPIVVPIIIIGTTTFFVAMLGMLFGKKTGGKLGKKMETVGGIILIGIGIKILIEHLYF